MLEQAHNKDDMSHRFKVAREDPLANFMVYKMAANALDDGFKLLDSDGNEFMFDCQDELKALNAKEIMTQTLSAERGMGWAWLHVIRAKDDGFREETEKDTRPVVKLDYWTPLDSEVTAFGTDGQPSQLTVKVLVGSGPTVITEERPLPISQFVLWRTRPYDRGYKGDPVTYNVWDVLVDIREAIDSMAAYNSKIGKGQYVVKLAKTPDAGTKADLEAEMETFSTRKAVATDPDKVESVGYVGSSTGSSSFESDIKLLMERLAAGAQIPKDILIGATSGAITGSETNIKALYATLSNIQYKAEVVYRQLIEMMGYTEEYDFSWNTRLDMNQLKAAMSLSMRPSGTLTSKTTQNNRQTRKSKPEMTLESNYNVRNRR
jgi:hypothetical protein